MQHAMPRERVEARDPGHRHGQEQYAAVQVFATPCRTRRSGMEVEGLGIVFLEASAAGLPIIVGDSGGAPDTVRDGETGFLVGGHDVRALADRLTGLLHDTSLARGMGRKGRIRVGEEWGWEQGYGQPAALLGQPVDGLSRPQAHRRPGSQVRAGRTCHGPRTPSACRRRVSAGGAGVAMGPAGDRARSGERQRLLSEAGSCTSSTSEVSSSPKSGAWKGLVVGGGNAAVEERDCPSGAENSDVRWMRGLPFVAGP
ncbi:putative Glycosyl transferase group 1 [Streptomyces viridochromogenes Tue57]|uniref:Putative Glycosyl transferase group 1 n=1 Tax=Streptomyces viridochromogenes Tue57 TaxID=1160705 RepID=L8PEZ1_STRVR|nr:putative Glycosyl transferase group 1 [Streptomyces viridochromogenes Tue57]